MLGLAGGIDASKSRFDRAPDQPFGVILLPGGAVEDVDFWRHGYLPGSALQEFIVEDEAESRRHLIVQPHGHCVALVGLPVNAAHPGPRWDSRASISSLLAARRNFSGRCV